MGPAASSYASSVNNPQLRGGNTPDYVTEQSVVSKITTMREISYRQTRFLLHEFWLFFSLSRSLLPRSVRLSGLLAARREFSVVVTVACSASSRALLLLCRLRDYGPFTCPALNCILLPFRLHTLSSATVPRRRAPRNILLIPPPRHTTGHLDLFFLPRQHSPFSR